MEEKRTPSQETVDGSRRKFLRNSVYAAYATPLITTLLVEDAAAGQSCTAELLADCIASGFKEGKCKKCL